MQIVFTIKFGEFDRRAAHGSCGALSARRDDRRASRCFPVEDVLAERFAALVTPLR
jgi:hypothetical protein